MSGVFYEVLWYYGVIANTEIKVSAESYLPTTTPALCN